MESVLYSIRASFYGLYPSETFCRRLEDIPNVFYNSLPFILFVAFMDVLYIRLRGKPDQWRLHEAMVGLGTVALANATGIVLYRSVELSLYNNVYSKWRMTTLPGDSYVTYVFALLGVEFSSYWWHRAAHEVALLWAAHHIHHGSEDMNIFVGNRVSIFKPFSKWVFYVPLVYIGLPPCALLLHMQLSVTYAAWTHSDTIPKISKIIPGLGHVIEYILVTPSHHRVHHGANKYCLGKNYGMVLIIFDRIFGTFAEEREEEPVIYGILPEKNTYHIVGIQMKPPIDLWNKVLSMDTLGNKVRALFYGPDWMPGTPRLGNRDKIPNVTGRRKRQFVAPLWFSIYLAVNVCIIFLDFVEITARYNTMYRWLPLTIFGYVVLSCTSIGALYDARPYGAVLEPLRLLLHLLLSRFHPFLANPLLEQVNVTISGVSLLFTPAIASYLTADRAKQKENGLERAGEMYAKES